MLEKKSIEMCVGCKACKKVCPKNAIDMVRNNEGFEYPCVNEELCVKCGKCLRVCPLNEKYAVPNNEVVNSYVVRNRDKNVVLKSSSGGVFNALASKMLELSGVVYGVSFDKNFNVKYIRGTELSDIEKMQGSKYVDAYISDECINSFILDVKEQKHILFTGTSCQVAGMISLCNTMSLNMDKIIWIDFYRCSGKVSSLLWEEELKRMEKEGEIKNISFRDKSKGWENFSFAVRYEKKKNIVDFLNTNYGKFLGNSMSQRLSCVKCGYECGACGSDISLGDYWYKKDGIPKQWNDNIGMSMVQVNTKKGQEYFNQLQDYIDYKELANIDYVNKREGGLNKKDRDDFWKMYMENGYLKLCESYAKVTVKDKILFGVVRPFLIRTKIIDIVRKCKDHSVV